jgi:hypothetical protein
MDENAMYPLRPVVEPRRLVRAGSAPVNPPSTNQSQPRITPRIRAGPGAWSVSQAGDSRNTPPVRYRLRGWWRQRGA